MRDGLTPETRTNRNGVVQTRWVRPDDAPKRRVSHIPVPRPAVQRTGPEWPLRLLAEYDGFLQESSYLTDSWGFPMREFRTVLPELGSDRGAQVVALMRAVDDLPGHNVLVRALGSLVADSHRISVDYRGAAVDNLLACIPRDRPEGKGFSKSVERGVDVFEAHRRGRIRKPFDEEYAAACRHAAAVLRDAKQRTFSAEDAVAVLPALVGHLDRFESVMSELARRRTFSREVAADILGSHAALGEGVL